MRFSVWFENRDMIAKGYRRMASIKYGPHAGKPGWYHPGTGQVVPDEEVGSLSFNRPSEADSGGRQKDGRPDCSVCGKNSWTLKSSNQGVEEYQCECGNKFEDRTKMVEEFMSEAERIQDMGFYFVVKKGRSNLQKSGSLRRNQYGSPTPPRKASKKVLESFGNAIFASNLSRSIVGYDPEKGLFVGGSPDDSKRYRVVGKNGLETLYVVPNGIELESLVL